MSADERWTGFLPFSVTVAGIAVTATLACMWKDGWWRGQRKYGGDTHSMPWRGEVRWAAKTHQIPLLAAAGWYRREVQYHTSHVPSEAARWYQAVGLDAPHWHDAGLSLTESEHLAGLPEGDPDRLTILDLTVMRALLTL